MKSGIPKTKDALGKFQNRIKEYLKEAPQQHLEHRSRWDWEKKP